MIVMYFLNLNLLLLIVFLALPYWEANAQESCDECKDFVKKLNKIDDTDECRSTCKRDQNQGVFTLEPKCGKRCCKELCKGKKAPKACEKQNYCVDCTNDPDYQLKGDPEKDCDFIAENPDLLCPKKGALEGCPETCNPVCAPPSPTAAPTIDCTDDPEFQLKGDPEKDCAYIAENTELRCPKKGALEGCPATCNPECVTASPTISPSPMAAPTIDCTDDPEYQLKGDPEKDCAYIAEDTELRCPKKGALEGCPATCNSDCGTTEIDPICKEKLLECLPCVERGCFFYVGGSSNGACSDCRPIKSRCDNITGYCVGISIRQPEQCELRLKEGCEQYLV